MMESKVNINTYLNILVLLVLTFFSYVGMHYEKRFDRIDEKFEKIDAKFERMETKFDAKLDKIIELVYDNKVKVNSISAKQEHLESRISKLEHSK